ncbi:alpha/beta fold hydrolase [Plastoroseomonas hellenica]|uniref:alpha/beta fold hydrolase n=1 Tax=Plastoroseomonas hellenica TaxID=2687306 RepID=UPI001BA8A532|nr:alpha/beta hydrolase [Plastoroseomonas hellenica]MBR0641469.1 alpha/beta hydrolase [Plastoroseomonas hellenica]
MQSHDRATRLPASPARGRLAALPVAALLLGAAAVTNYLLARRTEDRHPPRGRFVEADGVRLHYLERGEGKPVILLHGNGAMAEDFAISGVFQRLAARHRVIAFDRPGFGYSERPRDRVWTASEQAAVIREALRQLGVRRPIILGHSWGAMVALELALADPLDTSGLVLLAGYYAPTARMDVALLSGTGLPVLGDLLRYTVSPLLGRLLGPWFVRKLFAPQPVTAEFREQFSLEMALRPSQLRAMGEDTALMVPSAAALAKRYPALSVPAIVMAAAGDRIVGIDRQSRALHEQLRRSELWIVDWSGHMVHHMVPEDVVAAVTVIADAAWEMPVSALPSTAANDDSS